MNNKKKEQKGNNRTDNDSININNEIQRTITIWHGQIERQVRKMNGVWMERFAPNKGIRSLSVSPRCNSDAYTLAKDYEGFIPTPTQISQLKWVEVPVELEVNQ